MSNRLNEKIQAHIVESDNACHEPFARAISLFLYHTETNYKKIPYNLKYNGAIAMGKYFARALARKIKKSPLYADVDLIIPVPLYWFRKWKRGYNQAEIIAKEVSKELDVPMDTKTLKRLRNTTTQTKLEVADKSANVDRAFKASIVDKTLCERRHILIIDDVFTTGSTLASCQWELRKILGPDVRISVATLAYVD